MVWVTINDKEEDHQILGRCVPPLQIESATANSMLSHLRSLHIGSRASVVRLSGIACVIGIASREPHIIEELIENGMNIALLNFAHGTQQYHAEVFQNIRTAMTSYNHRIGMYCPVAIALVTKGPIIRTGWPIGSRFLEITLYEGEMIKLTGDSEYIIQQYTSDIIYVGYENLQNVIKIGNVIFIDDKRVQLVCTGIEGVIVTCRVIQGGDVSSRMRVHLPGIAIDLPVLSEKDRRDLQFALEHGIDIIFASFIRNGAAVKEIRDFLGPEGQTIKILSQIENQQGLANIDEIIKASDGVVVARGDLCNEMNDEQVFLAQKSIISKCNSVGKPVMCTTQLLESMVKKSRPTRAESSDVANAILDGADCILLYHETAVGDYPVISLKKAADICKQAEAAVWQKQLVLDLSHKITPPVITVHAVATAAVEISLELLAAAIIVISSSLKSAQLLTQYRPKCPVIAVTRSAQKARQAHLFRGILPLLYKKHRANDWLQDLNSRVFYGINFGRKRGFIRPGDPVVIMTCSKQGSGFTDKMKILYVSSNIAHGAECIC